MKKPTVTKTLGPIHFEDLDPKRFEDLVRELVYDLRDWQSIEATGRGGADDGFDIRAYEKIDYSKSDADTEEEEGTSPHPMDGNKWMIQCKREQAIGPSRVISIITDCIDPNDPPYGYVLVAPANFSKKCFDEFRKLLREFGVMEFYLWGRAALEDLLLQPKNDHILFAFFGVSLSTRKRTRSADVRARVLVKNRLIKLLGESPAYAPVLIRDIEDEAYPFPREYSDFKKRPRWKEYSVIGMEAMGLVVEVSSHFAYFDRAKQEWDAYFSLNLLMRHDSQEEDEKKAFANAEAYWDSFPSLFQAKLTRLGLLKFDSIVVVDPLGDSEFRMPHLYAVYRGKNGPFYGFKEQIKINRHDNELVSELQHIEIFPKDIPDAAPLVNRRDIEVELDTVSAASFKQMDPTALYSVGEQFSSLNAGDVITIVINDVKGPSRELARITNKRRETFGSLSAAIRDSYSLRAAINAQIGDGIREDSMVTICDLKIVYDWQIENKIR